MCRVGRNGVGWRWTLCCVVLWEGGIGERDGWMDGWIVPNISLLTEIGLFGFYTPGSVLSCPVLYCTAASSYLQF